MKKIIVIIAVFGMIACTGQKATNHQQNVSCASQEQYNPDIDELENLVSEIVRLEYQYMETRDESVAAQGEKLCERLRELTYSLDNKINEGKLSIEQQKRINEILERLPK